MVDYSLAELARIARVTPRTVRYYIAQGLLPSPGRDGPATRYPDAYLSRLRLIRKLQEEHLPLAEIRARLAALTDEDVLRLGQPTSETPGASAVDYIRGVLGRSTAPGALSALVPSSPPPEPPPSAPLPSLAPGRSQWERIVLAPDVELHIRRPLTRMQNRRVEQLIARAREILEEE